MQHTQVYLPAGGLEATDITTAKCSEVNLIVPGASGASARVLWSGVSPQQLAARLLRPQCVAAAPACVPTSRLTTHRTPLLLLPSQADDADPVESPIPEQFVTRFRGGRWVTEPVAHSGA